MKRKRILALTAEQIDFRNKILKIKPKPKKEKPLPPPPKVTTRNEYMNNCMWWINEFEAGRTEKDRFIQAVNSLHNHCIEILRENTPQKTKG